ncbi:MAG: MBL fold metallo-hydrolase [Gemmatimonadetes bacterium]|nr:MBL fold metallo-hydrolase [Gemmatimonadota bacterium]
MSWPFTRGLHDIGNGHYAYLQPSGTWGYSNAGLVIDGEQSLLVDTLFDEALTAQMLKTMKDATGIGGAEVTTLINTHANGDHTFGNSLVTNAEIVASKASAEEMSEQPPTMLAEFVRQAPSMGDFGEYLLHCFAGFDFDGVTLKTPTKVFSGELDIAVGDKTVKLIEVGPAHTHGDVLAYVPDDGVVYTGDILFVDGTPIMWAGPVRNWIDACNSIIDWAPDVVVPGHGPITDPKGVAVMRDYLIYVDEQARRRYDAGMSVEDAIFDISLTDYSAWDAPERIAVNVATLYREYSGDDSEPDTQALFGLMARLYKDRR